ncbi:amino acid transporter [Melanogaster broomeanus]|nr:amino acid transporter [Melanogaster broomeanus]
MFSQNTKQRDRSAPGDAEASQPLLNRSQEDLVGGVSGDSEDSEELLFVVQDDDDLESDGGHFDAHPRRAEHTVRFQEEVQVIGPPLRSTVQSREAEYELDSDDFDDTALAEIGRQLTRSHPSSSDRRRERPMPLLVGLLDSPTSRTTPETTIPMHESGSLTNLDLSEVAAKQHAGGGMLDSIANMANSILGAGLPYAVSQAVLLVVLCGVTDWTIRLVATNAKLSGRNSYIEIMDSCFGPSGRAVISLFQFAFAFGGMCAFGIIIGDTIPHVIRSIFPTLDQIPVLSIFTNRQFIIALCTICISYPLSLHRDIHKLSRASGLALLGMLIIVTSVLVEGQHVTPELKGDPSKRLTFVGPGVFQAIGVISFAFVCHHNSLLIYGSLRTPTLDRFARVTHISTAISLVACCTLGVSAFWVFTEKTEGNILNNFSPNDTLINVARFCFGLNIEVIEQYFFSHESFNLQRHVFFTTTILCASMLLALITCDLGVTLEITGGVSATALAYIFPAACYLKLIDPRLPLYSRTKLPAVTCLVFGVLVMSVSLFLALGKAWTVEGGAKLCRS